MCAAAASRLTGNPALYTSPEFFNDFADVQAPAFQMDFLERPLRLKALRAGRLELHGLSCHQQIDDDVLHEVLRGVGSNTGASEVII